MGKISNYANVLKSKLADLFVVYQRNDGELETKNATLEQLGDAICGEQVHATLETDDQTIIGGINELAKDKNIADEYDDTHTYNIGDITIYGNTLYICTTNNTTGDFDPSNWTATTVQSLIGSLSTLTTTDKSSIVGAVNEVNSYKSGDTITFNFQQLFCRIDASGKRISVFIPLNKKIPSTATVTASGNYSVYYYDGSSLLSNHDIANDTQSIQNTPIGIVLTITLTNALSQTLGYGAVELRNTFTLTFS